MQPPKRRCLSAYRSEKLAHAWLIGGPEGIGKATLAWRFARFLLANPDPERRRKFAARAILASISTRHAVRQVDGAGSSRSRRCCGGTGTRNRRISISEIRVEDVRHALQLFQKSAGAGGWRICIVDSAEDLNRAGANALLKMIEEPPPRSLFLIVAHRPGQVLPTIRSRCRRLSLERLRPPISPRSSPGSAIPGARWRRRDVAGAAARADGSVREALKRIDPAAGEIGAMIEAAVAQLPRPRLSRRSTSSPTRSARAAPAMPSTRLMNALYDWLAARARGAAGGAALRRLPSYGTRFAPRRARPRRYNLDKKLHVLSVFAELSAAARRL